jgi:hypothetical protein
VKEPGGMVTVKVPIWSLTASEAGLIAGASQGEIGHQCDCWNEETVSLAVKLLNTIGADCMNALLVGNLEGLETDGPKGRKRRFAVAWGSRSTLAGRSDHAPLCRDVGGHYPSLRTRRVAAAAGQSFLVGAVMGMDWHSSGGMTSVNPQESSSRAPAQTA